MAEFLRAYNITIVAEGGYSNNPADRGGETFMGISRKNFPNWEGWKLFDTSKSIPESLVIDFYRKEFWDKQLLDILSHQRMANKLFDCSVNMGLPVSGTFLQRCLNSLNLDSYRRQIFVPLVVDGIIGQKTISAFNLLSEERQSACLKLFTCLRGSKYLAIEEADQSQKIFMLGWLNRI